MKLCLLITIILLTACGQTNVKNNQPVAVKVNDEVYALDQAASLAINDKDSKDHVICQEVEQTGTRFRKKTCTTKRQREFNRKAQKDRLRDAQSIQRVNQQNGG